MSRGFCERHGMGPIAWLKARRLEAVLVELCAVPPEETTVTAVELRYGFDNLGRFGESPSQTLRN